MKTIVFVLPNLNQGGAEKVIVSLVNGLDRNIYLPKLILFEKKGFFLQQLDTEIEVIELNVSRIRYSIFKIIPLINKLKPDIVFVGWGEISAFLSPIIPFFRKIKFVTRETNVVSEHVKRREILFFYKFYHNFHKIIAQSDDMELDLIKNLKIDPTRIVKINNPVEVEFIEEKVNKSEKLYSEEEKNVVAVGNLTSRKGFDQLLEVFTYLKEEPIKLYILGEGEDREKLLDLKENLGLKKVEFLGIKENPFPYMAQADLFVLSSRYEGFPNVLLEAGVCGTYALVNDCPGGIREIIQTGKNGEIADIKKSKEFAEKIKQLLSKNWDKNQIKESIISRFSKEKILDIYNRELDKV